MDFCKEKGDAAPRVTDGGLWGDDGDECQHFFCHNAMMLLMMLEMVITFNRIPKPPKVAQSAAAIKPKRHECIQCTDTTQL